VVDESCEVTILHEVTQKQPEWVSWRKDEKRIALLHLLFLISTAVLALAKLCKLGLLL
jgi:hypothetical protein